MENRSLPQFPASVRVVQTLRERIEKGYYGSGGWLPAERDLANELSVSRPVIRAALSQLTEQGLVVRKPGCRPQVNFPFSSGQAAVVQRVSTPPRTIAAVMSQAPIYVCGHTLLRGIGAALRQKESPYHLVVCDTHPTVVSPGAERSDAAWERTYLERIETEGAAGVILWHIGGAETLPIIQRIRRKGVPVVMVDRYSEDLECDYVGVDNKAGVKQAVEYLLGLGHQRIAYLMNNENVSSVAERLEGYREAMEAHWIPPEVYLVKQAESYVGYREAMEAHWTPVAPELIYNEPTQSVTTEQSALDHFFGLSDPPTAIVTANDYVAFRLIREAQARGVRVPEDLSVVGFDDIEAYSPQPAMLTSVHQPFYDMGQRAAELLLYRQSRPETVSNGPYRHILLPTSQVIRTSCGPPRGA